MSSTEHRDPADPQDRQLAHLAGELRERGQEPPRDLWPGIDAAIARAESARLRPVPSRRAAPGRWLAAAAAAALLLAAGWWGVRLAEPMGPDGTPGPILTAAGSTQVPTRTAELSAIDLALDEVNLALAADPHNRSLTNLAVMLHRSRGRMLRQSDAMHITGS